MEMQTSIIPLESKTLPANKDFILCLKLLF